VARKIGRIVLIVLSVFVVVCLVLASLGYITSRRSFPKVSGEIQLPGLDAPVDIYRDGWGVPQIYAHSRHDLFFAQGYVHAQDRFWQMDFWRHLGSGRLAELFGEAQVETDTFLRTMGWARVAQRELDLLDAESTAILEAYADGVNAYLADHQGSALSLEYAILKLMNAGYQPEPWQPLHTLTWGKVMAYSLGGNMDLEQFRAILLKTLTPEQVADLFPPYPVDHPVIVPGFSVSSRPGSLQGLQAIEVLDLASAQEALSRQTAALDALLGLGGAGLGSNSWVISGERTNTGRPLLANDPHLAAQMPSIWYEIGLHCAPQGTDCPYEVTGVSFAGAPGVIIGHNDRIVWSMTNVGPDVQDLYIEKLNPENPNQYEVNGQWVDMDIINETLQVAGGEPVELTVRYTRHGPLIWEDSLDEFQEQAGIELPEPFGLALRWTALEPSYTFPALWKMNLAQNWDEFRAAASEFDVPSQNLVYADVEGNIGYQTPGRIPIRAEAHSGELPVPGWTDDYEWQGTIPFEELPYSFNPVEGYIVTANNAVVGPDYPYLLSSQWDYGYRAQRIVDMIEAAPGPIDIAYIQQMQGDNKNLNADSLLPILLQIPLDDERLENARSILAGWDGQQPMDSAPAALFEVFWKHLLKATFGDDLPEDLQPWGGDLWFEVMRPLVEQPDSPWWDNQTTPEVEARDQIVRQAFAAAVDELEETLGKKPERWAWGDLHTTTFRNQSLGDCGIGLIEAIFNRGPFRTSGGASIVNATGWDASESYAVGWLPSMRMVVDLGDLSNSLLMHTTGQSGHAYHPHYIDMADPWRLIEYHPMLWQLAGIEAQAEEHLQLLP